MPFVLQTPNTNGCSRCNCEWDLPTSGNRLREEDVLEENEAENCNPQGCARNAKQAKENVEDMKIYESVKETEQAHENSYEDIIDSPIKPSRCFNSSKRSTSLKQMGHGSFTAYATNGKVKASHLSPDNLKIYAYAHTNGAAHMTSERASGDQVLHQSSNLGGTEGSRCNSVLGSIETDHESSTNVSVTPEDETGMTEYFDENELLNDAIWTNEEVENHAQEPKSVGCLPDDNLVDSLTTE